ncbi:4Fe-4S binding protein [Candidatus Bathyarchaeota archaeon]|nr:4Fe-4S binding protein [Candidatus Bathyarchaeota archaeon]RJS82518.1 MAG: 4Fe-4S dicluster domain-containing protein [Candidatus Bathyarchaeota archaeon]RLI23616.1 MAG: hypothetical protein DRO47_00015 [Candidatus Bathyarchaeota archaeon]HDN62569.1 4Fe-4S dicluster domain-containing protein [Candidatus Bathyarchaeota archaeon]
MSEKKPLWQTLPIAGILLEPKSSLKYKTGDWRGPFTPKINQEKCTRCLLCWIYCPDGAIERVGDGVRINLDYCKGCGICVSECPVKAITMERL